MTFEYDVISIRLGPFLWKPEENMKKFLKEKNDEGWELVTVTHPFMGKLTYIFKREEHKKSVLETFPNPGF